MIPKVPSLLLMVRIIGEGQLPEDLANTTGLNQGVEERANNATSARSGDT